MDIDICKMHASLLKFTKKTKVTCTKLQSYQVTKFMHQEAAGSANVIKCYKIVQTRIFLGKSNHNGLKKYLDKLLGVPCTMQDSESS